MSVVTLGCRLNQGESEQLARDFVARGYRVLRFWDTEVLSNIEGVLEAIFRHV